MTYDEARAALAAAEEEHDSRERLEDAMTDPDPFRRAYDAARAGGYSDTRAAFCAMVLTCPDAYRSRLVASARTWDRERRNEHGRVCLRDTRPLCVGCGRPGDLDESGLCWVCVSDREERSEAADRTAAVRLLRRLLPWLLDREGEGER